MEANESEELSGDREFTTCNVDAAFREEREFNTNTNTVGDYTGVMTTKNSSTKGSGSGSGEIGRSGVSEVVSDIGEKQLALAYDLWRFHHYAGHEVDMMLAPFIKAEIECKSTLRRSWLETARKAKLLSCAVVASRMGVSRAAYTRLEGAEADGRLTLRSIERAAQAMGCELVYYIRPKHKIGYSRSVWNSLLPSALHILRMRRYWKPNEGRVLAALARDLLRRFDFRQEHQWSMRQHAGPTRPT